MKTIDFAFQLGLGCLIVLFSLFMNIDFSAIYCLKIGVSILLIWQSGGALHQSFIDSPNKKEMEKLKTYWALMLLGVILVLMYGPFHRISILNFYIVALYYMIFTYRRVSFKRDKALW